jgi:hypothetical protein
LLLGFILPPAAMTDGIRATVTLFLSSELVILWDLNLDWQSPASDQFKSICIDFNPNQLTLKTHMAKFKKFCYLHID